MLILNAALFYVLFSIVFYPAQDKNWRAVDFLTQRATAGRLVQLFLTNDPLVYSHLWFLLALIYIYIFWLILPKKSISFPGLTGASLLIAYSLLQEFGVLLHITRSVPIPESNQRLYFYNLFIFRGLSFFLIGMSLKRNVERIQSWRVSWHILLLAGILGTVLAPWEYTKTNDTQFFIGNILASLSLIILAIKWPAWKPRFLCYVGRELSLYVYIFHIAVQKSLGLCFAKLHIANNTIIIYTMPILVLFATLAFSCLFDRIRQQVRLLVQNGKREGKKYGQ